MHCASAPMPVQSIINIVTFPSRSQRK